MTLEDWDKKIGPRLQLIEAGAAMAERHVRALQVRPGFDTLAQDELQKVREALESALAKIVNAQNIYHDKPLETA